MFAGLFTAIWFSWIGFTLYANRFDTDDVVFRVIKLAATLAIAGCAASATEATGDWAGRSPPASSPRTLMLAALYVARLAPRPGRARHDLRLPRRPRC